MYTKGDVVEFPGWPNSGIVTSLTCKDIDNNIYYLIDLSTTSKINGWVRYIREDNIRRPS